MPRVTIDTIAEKCGVSAVTVSRVLSGSKNVNENTRNLVLQSMRELNYRPHKLSQLYGEVQSNVVGIMTEDITRRSNAEIIQAAKQRLKERGYLTFICECSNDPEDQDGYLHYIINGGMAGCIVISGLGSRQKLKEALDARIPVVMVHWCDSYTAMDSVILDSYRSMTLCVNHLLELGHKKIVLFNSPVNASGAYESRLAYENALTDFGLPYDERYVLEGKQLKKADGNRAARTILESLPDATAVVCSNSQMAAGLAEEMEAAGRRIPEDLSIVALGIGQTGESNYRFDFTMVGAYYKDAGETAAQMMAERLQEKKAGLPISGNIKRVILEPHVFLKNTTAPAPTPDA